MPQHRRTEKLPQKLIDKVRSSAYSEFFGYVYVVEGGGLRGPRYGVIRPKLRDGSKPKIGASIDVQYILKEEIITRVEFVRGEPSIPIHMAHFDAATGKRFANILDCFA